MVDGTVYVDDEPYWRNLLTHGEIYDVVYCELASSFHVRTGIVTDAVAVSEADVLAAVAVGFIVGRVLRNAAAGCCRYSRCLQMVSYGECSR